VIAIVKKQEAISSRAELGVLGLLYQGHPQDHSDFQG
jgi:hypothetical protein